MSSLKDTSSDPLVLSIELSEEDITAFFLTRQSRRLFIIVVNGGLLRPAQTAGLAMTMLAFLPGIAIN
jgi:hypothetical protein